MNTDIIISFRVGVSVVREGPGGSGAAREAARRAAGVVARARRARPRCARAPLQVLAHAGVAASRRDVQRRPTTQVLLYTKNKIYKTYQDTGHT